eukprot:5899361-Prymnesium_polylepis.1
MSTVGRRAHAWASRPVARSADDSGSASRARAAAGWRGAPSRRAPSRPPPPPPTARSPRQTAAARRRCR